MSLVTRIATLPAQAKKNLARVVLASGLGLGGGAYLATDHYSAVPVAQAMTRPVGSAVRVTMPVEDLRDLGPRIGVLLNDVPYRVDPEGKSRHTVRVPRSASGYEEAKKSLGKTVRVVGTVQQYQGKNQIVAEEVEVK